MPRQTCRLFRSVRSSFAVAAAAVLCVSGGCVRDWEGKGESLSFNFGANPTSQPTESTVPMVGQIQKNKQIFSFVLKGRTLMENGLSVDKPYQAGISASTARLFLSGIVGALIRGHLGMVQTQTVKAYAAGTEFAVVTDPDGTTYVVHIDHVEGESVIVSLIRNSKTGTIPADGFIVVHPSDLVVAPFTPITDANSLAPLPDSIAKEIKALKQIGQNANVQ